MNLFHTKRRGGGERERDRDRQTDRQTESETTSRYLVLPTKRIRQQEMGFPIIFFC